MPLDFAMMSASKRSGVSSSTPIARWNRVAGAGTKPDDIEVEPEGDASRSTHDDVRAGGLRPERRDKAAGAGADDDDIGFGVDRVGVLAARPTGAPMSGLPGSCAGLGAGHAIAATVERSAIVRVVRLAEKAAQPSLSTVVEKSRTWASRTVEATPPLVTMPQTIERVDAGLAQHPFQPRHVEGRIGDLLDRKVGGLQRVDEGVAPASRREIALAEERPQLSSGAAR